MIWSPACWERARDSFIGGLGRIMNCGHAPRLWVSLAKAGVTWYDGKWPVRGASEACLNDTVLTFVNKLEMSAGEFIA